MIDSIMQFYMDTRSTKYKNKVFLSEDTAIDVNSMNDASNWLLIGVSSEGKTTAIVIICEQYDNAILVDCKGGGWNTIENLGLSSQWKLYTIREGSGTKNSLKINVRELDESSLNVITGGGGSRRGYMSIRMGNIVRHALRPFLSLPPFSAEKTFRNFSLILKKHRFEHLAEDLSAILDENDEGMTRKDIINGKKLVDVYGFNFDNPAPGVLVDTLQNYVKKSSAYLGQTLIGVDDVQKGARFDTALGVALGNVFAEGRAFNMNGLASGTNFGDLHKKVKANCTIHLWFSPSFDIRSLEQKYNAELNFDDIKNFKSLNNKNKGVCLFHARSHGFEPKIMYIDLNYYRKIREEKYKTVFKSYSEYLS